MKKILAVFAILAMFFFTACGNNTKIVIPDDSDSDADTSSQDSENQNDEDPDSSDSDDDTSSQDSENQNDEDPDSSDSDDDSDSDKTDTISDDTDSSDSKCREGKLKWENCPYGYHVMFKSLLENQVFSLGEKDGFGNVINPQGDTCKDSSTYTLDMSHIPADAIIKDAYLVWTAAQSVAKKNDPTDNEVSLSFVSTDGTITLSDTIKGKKAYKVTNAGTVDFEFDAFKDTDDPRKSWFTYRVNVRDFFQKIQEKGRANAVEGASFYDGYSITGNYTLSGLECTDDEIYKESTEMVADWSIILVYSSVKNEQKNIYIYDDFTQYWYDQTEIEVTGFELPADSEIRITFVSHEGDAGLATANPEEHEQISEGIKIQGEHPIIPDDWMLIWNKCNPEAYVTQDVVTLEYTEIFNSISSVYGYNDTVPTCIGGTPPVFNYDEIEYGMDVDTFLLNSETFARYTEHFHEGDKKFGIRIGANQDAVIMNYLIVSISTKN